MDPVRGYDWRSPDDRLRLSRQEIRELCESIIATRQDEHVIAASLDRIGDGLFEIAQALRERGP